MTEKESRLTNPLQGEPKPPFPPQHQAYPGLEKEMRPKPDFGEESYKGYGRLKDKVALVTGGDSGIGRAVALAYAREGADILISYLNEHPDAEETVRVVEESGRKAVAVPGDISNEQHCRQLIQQTLSEFGKIDILVNNAAFQMTHEGIEDLPSEEWEHAFRTNIFAMFYLCKAAFPHMKPGSTIINSASIEAYQPEPSLLAYASTKGAIVTFTKALAKEGIKKGIRVNAVAPGPVWTPLIVSTMPEKQETSFGKQDPEQRPAQPAELAPAYVFLALPESSYINADVIGVTGGTPLP
ncbi:MAG TPA: SDR family oxidoreductase [Chloroflexota bacterium]|nr:SDR family oxidoreductase [Chloroflexota bacterium]